MTATRSSRHSSSTSVAVRPRNAAVTKQAVLDAAQQLFGQNGFEGTTVRDIGERAGIDHALIARYFGSKADLYIAALVADARVDQPASDFEDLKDMADGIMSKMDESGLGPVMQALIRSDTSDQIRTAAQNHMARRLVDPIVANTSRRESDDPQLRSEIVASALIGVALGRALGWFDELRTVPRERLVDLVTEILEG